MGTLLLDCGWRVFNARPSLSSCATGEPQPSKVEKWVMEFFFEIVFQFLAEVLLQAFAELLLELGFHRLAKALKRPRSPALSTVGFALLGIVAGGISLLIFPASHIHDPMFRKLNLVVAPLALGLVMMLIGQIRQKKGQDLVRLDQFGYAFLFAFAMAVVRYIWAD